MIIGISGKKQSGKNTIATIWQALDLWYNHFNINILNRLKDQSIKTEIEYCIEILNLYKDININFGYWTQKSFAHKLKQFACLLFGCTLEDLEKEEFKNFKIPLEKCDMTYREFLQIVGTDLMKVHVHPNIWIDSLLSEYSKTNKENWLVTDCRFPEECLKISNLNGFIIRVNNKIKQKSNEHISEIALDNKPELFKYIIDNEGTLEDLILQVKQIMIKENIIKL